MIRAKNFKRSIIPTYDSKPFTFRGRRLGGRNFQAAWLCKACRYTDDEHIVESVHEANIRHSAKWANSKKHIMKALSEVGYYVQSTKVWTQWEAFWRSWPRQVSAWRDVWVETSTAAKVYILLTICLQFIECKTDPVCFNVSVSAVIETFLKQVQKHVGYHGK